MMPEAMEQPGGGAGGDDVVLEDAAVAEHPQHGHRDDGGGNGGGDGEAGEQADVGVPGREQHGEHDGENDGAHAHLRRVRRRLGSCIRSDALKAEWRLMYRPPLTVYERDVPLPGAPQRFAR